MNTRTNSRKWSWIPLNERRAARTAMLLLLLLLTLPTTVQAQFTYTTNNGTITITKYTGYGSAVTVPDTINGLPVTRIGDAAFSSSPNLTSVTIPDSVVSIGANAFYDCIWLSGVTIPDSVTNIGSGAFAICQSLTSITIPEGVTSIADATFEYCKVLESVTIPDSVVSIGASAFYSCGLYTAMIGNGVRSIGDGAFWCGVSAVIFQGNAPSLVTNVFGGANNAIVYYMPGTVGWGPTFGGRPTVLWNLEAQFNYTTTNGTITITGYTGPGSAVTIPSTINGLPVTSIGDSAFSGCRLSSITIPSSVTSIGVWAFVNCGGLTSVTMSNGIISIGSGAFQTGSRLPSVTIPSSVTSIGDYVFGNCTSLTNIMVDPLNPAYSSVDGILFNKSQTTLVEYPGGKAGRYTIPNSVTSIGNSAFLVCPSLTGVTIPNSVTSIGDGAFEYCGSLTNIAIPNSVTNIGYGAFAACYYLTRVTIGNSVVSIGNAAFFECGLTSVTVPNSVTSIGQDAFGYCTHMKGIYFQGNAPSLGLDAFEDNIATVYYLPGTTGWGTTYGGRPTALWIQVPTIQTPPQTQTAEAGSTVDLWVDASSPLPLFYLWRLNDTNLMSWSTNCDLELTNIQFSQSGAYAVVISNVLGAATSGPAMLNVIAAVERRPVPGVRVSGEAGSLLNVDYASLLSHSPDWTPLGAVSLTGTSQYYFDLTLPLPPQRFYRAWQTGTPGVIPSLELHMVPGITLTGNIGGSVRVDYINQFGPTDARVTLDTVTLTNTSQLYFDVSAPGRPQRLYRLVPLP
jgi:hypothetical protein